jgi:hypothetical protein
MWDNVAQKCAPLVLLGAVAAAGCAGTADEEAAANETAVTKAMEDGAASDFPEAVQVLASNGDFCTGVLVSPTRALTAGHCLSTGVFTIVAPFAPHAAGTPVPSVPGHAAEKDRIKTYTNVDSEDALAITLDKPIQLASYPELRDIGELEGKPALPPAIAVGRRPSGTASGPALVKSKPLTVESASHRGYLTGVKTQQYSEGGDSGGPLFLIEGKKHVLIGLERDPDGTIDLFSRITPSVRGLLGP